jgi:lipopolysaccharide transport system ATP-binding protein
MNDAAIRVENLGKRYRIGGDAPYKTLRDALARAVTAPLRNVRSAHLNEANLIWALKDISFEVKRGDVVGLIGRNGSGKSTLLKILSRVTKPTVGHAQISGRLGSLLEVGTGFHPELTGRENTYLNGAILGMSRKDINSRFDEIVSFAEIEEFIDTPVKHYSSGMYVRLAFSVAAHLEPEILFVDEVLAVGDVAFQKKCLGRMGDVAKQGRTVLFVSHNMGAIALLCKSVIVLERGRIKAIGDSDTAITEYLTGKRERSAGVYNLEGTPRAVAGLRKDIEFLSVEFEGVSGKPVPTDADLTVIMTVRGNQDVDEFRFALTITSAVGYPVGSCAGAESLSLRKNEVASYRMVVPNPRLAPGHYYFDLAAGIGNERTGTREFDVVDQVLHFEVMAAAGQNETVSEWQKGWGAIRFSEPKTSRYS